MPSSDVAPVPPGKVRHGDLARLAGLVGAGFAPVDGPVRAGDTVASGFLCLQQVRPGLLVHASDVRHERPVTTRLLKNEGFNVSIVLRGGWRGTLGNRPLACGGSGPQAAFFVLAEPDLWHKQAAKGDQARMVNVMVSPAWLALDGSDDGGDEAAAIGAFLRRHRESATWRPSSRLIGLAEQIVARRPGAGGLRRLSLESRAIDILDETLGLIGGAATGGAPHALHPHDLQRLRRVRDLLESDGPGPASLVDVAREAGMSLRSLQRKFRKVYGVPPAAHLAASRLERARRLLERDGLSVAQAAHSVGYGDAANFATAFKRRFGLSPKRLRARC